ncbi:MAG: VOC family protein [Methanomassiliicoccus sp.]|nr:VOC family protein [Methanomassiliicoccus sp.]
MPLGDPMGGETPEIERGKLLRIGQVWVPVSDLSRAVEVYTTYFGLSLVATDAEHGHARLALKDGGTEVVLYLPGEGDEEPGIRTGVTFITDSIYDFHKVLVDEAVDFTVKPQRDASGRLIARFTDEDGNEFEVLELPGR